MIWHTLSTFSVLERLDTNVKSGLSSDKAESRTGCGETNELPRAKGKSLLRKFLEQFNDYMIIILLVAAAVSFFLAIYEGKNDFVEPIAIIVIVFLNAVISLIQAQRAEKALEALKNITKPTAMVLRDGIPCKLPASQLVRGDIILLKAGDRVPADARIITSNNLTADESSLTGESVPVKKNGDIVFPEDTPVADMVNMVWSSSTITVGNGVAVVVEIGAKTQVGKIAQALIDSDTPQTPLQLRLEKTGKVLGTAALGICFVVFVAGVFRQMKVMDMFMTSVSLAVAAIPEGLPAIVTVVLALGVQRMVKKNAVVKKLPAVETLGSATVICSDKTGTLTQNKMSVTEIFGDDKEVMTFAGICCNNTDSTEQAITDYINNRNFEIQNHRRIKEIPFSSAYKYMAVTVEYVGKYLTIIKGAPDVVIPKCRRDNEQSATVASELKKMTDNALRVLAVAYIKTDYVPDIQDLHFEFCGLIGISDPPRPEIPYAIKSCRRAGIKPVMITGDHADTACAIARKIGMPSNAITGKELDRMSDGELNRTIKSYSIFARVTPEHKVKIVRALQAKGEVVAMTGDGVNDAPALKQADIGCAMGITGTDVAKGAADMILTDDNFATIVEAVKEGRSIFANIKKAVHFLLSSNIGEIITIFCAILAGLPSPLTAVQLLWVNLITDSLPAIALGADSNNYEEIMSQKPVKKNQSLFAEGNGLTMLLEGLLIGVLALTAFCTGYFKYGSCETGQTMAFCVLSISQLIHVYNVRCRGSIFAFSQPRNMFVHLSVLTGIVLQLCTVVSPIMSGWLGTTMLTKAQWNTVAILVLMPVVVVEISKFISKKR